MKFKLKKKSKKINKSTHEIELNISFEDFYLYLLKLEINI